MLGICSTAMLIVSDHMVKALSVILSCLGFSSSLVATMTTLVATLMVTTTDFLGTLFKAFDWFKNITGVSTRHVWSIGTQMRIWSTTISTGDIMTIGRSGTSNVFDTFPDEGSEMSDSTSTSSFATWESTAGVDFVIPSIDGLLSLSFS